MKALGQYVVVKPISDQIESKGVLLSSSSEKNVTNLPGEVVTVGDDVKNLEKGDRVYYKKVAASAIRVGEEVYDIMEQIHVVLKE